MDDDPSTFSLTWEDDSEVVQTEEEVISAMENEIIPSQSEEFLGGVPEHFAHEVVESEELVEEVVEEEVIPESSTNQDAQLSEHTDSGVMYLQDGNVLVMHDGNNQASYTQEQLMEVTEEIITDQWGESCPEEIIIGSEEAVADGGTHLTAEEDIPLPTAQDEYTAARPYPCDFCSRRFRKKANLMNHMVAHQTDRPHGCNLCGVRYMRKSDLMNHLKSHAYVPESDPINEENLLLERPFEKPKRKTKTGYGKGRKKKQLVIKEEYESMFTTAETATTSASFDYQEQEYMESELDNSQDYLSAQEDIKYPVVDPKKPFVCQHCGVGFAREKALASHSRIHGGDSPFECQKCGEMFWDIALMQEHTRSKHGGIGPEFDEDEDGDYSDSGDTRFGTFYCPTCGLSFHRQDNLRRHQRIHIKEEFINDNEQFGHICNVCGESFQEALDLLAHAEVHARGTEYRCMICGEQCPDETSLANHVQGIHKSLPPHTCALCGRTCKDSRALLKHSWEHSKVKSFGCTKCSKTFHNKARLKRHMLSHRNKVVQCDVCGEDFPDGRSLMNHRHSHSSVSGRQFPCKECGKTFGSRSSQQIHVRIHTGERPYGCRFCWKAFADGGTLRKHERIHTGEKPYACAVCPRAFNQRVVLREHIRSHHSGPDPKYSQSMTPYCCAVCSDMFATSQDLILHLIHHCDMNTALKRQPQVGPRKYKRRRKLKPHELEIITHHAGGIDEEMYEPMAEQEEEGEEEEEEVVEQEYEETLLSEEDKEGRRRVRSASGRTSGSSPKASLSESMSDMYSGLATIEGHSNVETSSSISHLTKSPTSKIKLQKRIKGEVNLVVPSRPKMIHTQKTRVAVDDGRVKHKTKTLVTRTQPAEIKSSTGERIRPRTKNVNYHILNPDKLPLATFPASDQQTQEAVDSLLNATALLEATPNEEANGHLYTEEVIDQAPDVASEQIVETQTQNSEEVPVPVGIVAVRTRRNSARSAKNVIGPGSKVRLVKEGMVVSKLKRNSESQQEPECILPDVQHSEVVIKEEYVNNDNPDDSNENNITEEEVGQRQLEEPEYQTDVKEGLLQRLKMEKSTQPAENVINVKQEIMDPSALHELAEISMRHANNSANFFKCEMCDEVFSDRAQLLVHVPIHI